MSDSAVVSASSCFRFDWTVPLSAPSSDLAAGVSVEASSAPSAASQSWSNRSSRAMRFGDSGSGGATGAPPPRAPRVRMPPR